MIWAALAIPSWPIVLRFGGMSGAVIYAALLAAAVFAAPRVAARLPLRSGLPLAVAAMLAVTLLFAAMYPRLNVHTPGRGSDDDDAHNVGVAALLDGHSPYGRVTYLGNRLHQLPGSFILALPFALVGTSALQNLFGMAAFFALLRRYAADDRAAAVALCLTMFGSAGVLHAVVTGSSYPWSAIWAVLGIEFALRRPRTWWAPLFLGLALCSRPNFVLLLVPVVAAVWRTHGQSSGLRFAALAAAAMAVLVVPFDPFRRDFPPLEGYGRLEQLDALVPWAGAAVLAATTLVTATATVYAGSACSVYRWCAAILATPVICGLAMGAFIDRATMLSFAPYGLFALWFVVLGSAEAPRPDEPRRPVLLA